MRYVNPAAPKGGAVSLQLTSTFGNQAFDTFNTLNVYVLKGDGAAGMNLDLRQPDGARLRRAGRHVRAGGAERGDE